MMHLKKPNWIAFIAVLALLNACKKQDIPSTENTSSLVKNAGAVADDEKKLSSLHMIVSSDFLAKQGTLLRKGGPNRDSDGDGIPDTKDACPTQPETFNGYQDTDGCPDTPPTTVTTDLTAPTVAITSPSSGSSVSGSVSVNVNASDNVSVTSVTYTLDGSVIGTSTTSPFSISWNADAATDGVHTLTARAYDAAGNNASNSISVTKNTTVITQPPASTSYFQLKMPPVGDQGSEYSCVAFAVGYAARSAEQYYRTGATSYSNSTNIFSPEFLYDLTKVSADCGSGSSIMTALDYIKANGICRWQTLPYSYTDGCSSSVSTTAFSDAANYKIPSYSGVYKSDIAGIKAMLQANHPLIFMVNLDNSFVNAPPGFIWKSYTTGASAGHAMVIVGYDDSKNAWRVMNSWGASWCENGYGWIDYNFFPQTGSAWTFVMNY